ncbi:MAG: O-antigen ligase family protein [Rhodothermales bacterium]|nr:O-antigen ligase family protein [Rhodothermales bacterium]
MLIAGFVGALLLLLAVVRVAPEMVKYTPALVFGAVAFLAAWVQPSVRFAVLIAGFVALTDYVPGIQLAEVAYGLFFLAYLAHWGYAKVLIEHRKILETPADFGVLTLLVVVICYVPISLLFGANTAALVGELSAFVLFAIYFPAKDAMVRLRYGPAIVLGCVLFIGVFVSIRNILEYKTLLLHATQAWQVAKGRVVTNDNILMVVCLYSLTLFSFARHGIARLGLLGLFLMFFAALILTQSRGYWLGFMLGGLILLVWLPPAQRRRLMLLAFGALLAGGSLAFLFFSNEVAVVIAGLLDRLFSLLTATSTDISLVNRFRETAAVWEMIKVNPVLGYGMGVAYPFFDIAHMATETDSFVHNGYVSMWYRYGLPGLGLVLWIWFSSIRSGIRAFRFRHAAMTTRLCGLASAVTLSAFLLTTNTSNPFYLNDTLFIFGFLLAVSQGALLRIRSNAEAL